MEVWGSLVAFLPCYSPSLVWTKSLPVQLVHPAAIWLRISCLSFPGAGLTGGWPCPPCFYMVAADLNSCSQGHQVLVTSILRRSVFPGSIPVCVGFCTHGSSLVCVSGFVFRCVHSTPDLHPQLILVFWYPEIQKDKLMLFPAATFVVVVTTNMSILFLVHGSDNLPLAVIPRVSVGSIKCPRHCPHWRTAVLWQVQRKQNPMQLKKFNAKCELLGIQVGRVGQPLRGSWGQTTHHAHCHSFLLPRLGGPCLDAHSACG